LNYKETYIGIVDEKNIDKIRNIFEKEGIFKYFAVQRIMIQQKKDFPFILMYVKPDMIPFAARMTGLFLDDVSNITGYEGQFYLPVICLHEFLPEKIAVLINVELSIEHELIHIRQIFELISIDSTYLHRVKKYGMENIKDINQIPDSIDLEVFKLFYLEPEAMKFDFDHGEITIRTQFMGKIMEYDCASVEEYTQMKIADYIDNFKEVYHKKFSDYPYEKLVSFFDESIKKYSGTVLGLDPIATLKKLDDSYPNKMLNGTLMKLKE